MNDSPRAKPRRLSVRAWLKVANRVKVQLEADHVAILAAGIAFFSFLALFPLLTILISVYGLVADPEQVEGQLADLASLLPASAHALVSDFARSLSGSSHQALSWGLVLSTVLSLWSAIKGSKVIVRGVSIAYNVTERRGFFKTTALSLVFTVAGLGAAALALVLVAAVPALPAWLGFSDPFASALGWLRWPVLAVLVMAFLGAIYRYAPNRERPELRWLSVGSVVATVLWLLASALFSLYVENLGKFEAIYGSFAAVVILMLWLYLTGFSILLGAEINSELEQQVEDDPPPPQSPP